MDWFRLYSEFATDAKVQMMPEVMQRRLIMLFCLQCSNGIETFHETERETSIAFFMRISDADLADTKELFLRRGFINSDWTLCVDLETGVNRPPAELWAEIRERIFMRDNYVCQYCGQRGGRIECDHVIPVSRGGGHDDENLVTACFSCNRSKRAKLVSEWRPE